MIIWGIYYESLSFTKFNFVDQYIKKENFTKVWGLLTVLAALAYFIGPLIASQSISHGFAFNLFITLLLFIFGYLVFVIAKTNNVFKKDTKTQPVEARRHSFIAEIKIWHILYKRLNFFWILTVVTFGVDAFLWTIGIVFSHKLAEVSPLGNLFIPLYVLPSIAFSLFAYKLTDKYGKKKVSYLSALLAGLLILLMGIVTNIYSILLITFFVGVTLSISYPAIRATFEDYIGRMQNFKNDLIGFEQAATSISYIVFPITFGFIAEYYGFTVSIFSLGVLVIATSILSMFLLPKKIKMPHKELIENN
jgi:MFS family permease